MSQADIDAFVGSIGFCNMLAPRGVTAAVAKGTPVNGLHSSWSATALHQAVRLMRPDVVVALLAVGADVNVKIRYGYTSMWMAAANIKADILQLLIEGGGNVNETNSDGETPLIALVKYNNNNNKNDAAAQLQVLLACPELDLDATYDGNTFGGGVLQSKPLLAAAIAKERRRRMQWSAFRVAWVAATVTPAAAPL